MTELARFVAPEFCKERGQQHRLAVWELQRIVMGHGAVHVDLPEACKAVPDFLVREDANAE